MFSHLDKKQFNLTDANFTQNLLDIAKLAGYDVIWKDNDDGCKKVCNRVHKIDAKIGNKQPFCFGNYCHDDILLDGLNEELNNINKDTLIVLHTMGSHGPTYYKRYPEQFKKFTPTCDTANLQDCTQEQIINTYDNTIVYTDYIISSVIDILKNQKQLETAMLYVSDHGESLGENNIYLHGLPYAIAPKEQKQVPMILWLSDTKKTSLNINAEQLRKKAETHKFSHDIVLVIGEEQLEINLWAPWQYRLSLNTLWDNVIKRQPDMHSIPIGGGVFSKMLYDISEGYADDFIGKKIKNIAIRSEEENVFGSISIELESGKSIKIYEHDDEEFIEAG